MALVRTLIHRELSKSTAWMSAGFGLTAAFQAGYFIIVARALGANGLGAFAAALALVSIAAPFSGLGAKNLLVMSTARDKAQFADYFGTAIVAVVVTGALLAVVCLGVGYAIFHGSQVAAVLPWVAASELGVARVTELVMHCYQAHERARAASLVLVASNGVRVIAAIVFVATVGQPTASGWAVWYFGASAITAVFALAFSITRLGRPGLGWGAAKDVLRNGIFYSVGSASQTIYADIDKTMLARLDTASVAGVYTGAYRLVGMLSTPVLAFVYAANPRFFREGERNAPAVWRLAQRARKLAVVYGAVTAVVCLIAAPLLPLILGASFKESSSVVRWLAVLPLIQAIHLIYGNALMGVGRQSLRSAFQVGTACLNAGLNLWLIPLYSWRGAAVATLCGEGLLAVAMVVLLYRAAHPRSPAHSEAITFRAAKPPS